MVSAGIKDQQWVVVEGDAECRGKELFFMGKHVLELGLRRRQSLWGKSAVIFSCISFCHSSHGGTDLKVAQEKPYAWSQKA